VSDGNVEDEIAAVRRYWEIGSGIIEKHGSDRFPYASEQEGKLTESERERRRKARQFARNYTAADLDALCELCRDHGGPR
jgi:hypothetical protein